MNITLKPNKIKIGYMLVALVTLLQAGTNWPAFRGGMNRSGFSSEQVGKPSARPLWVDTLGCAVASSPGIVDGVVYVGGRDGAVYALHAKTGRVKWRKQVDPDLWFDASPLVHNGMVFIGSSSSNLWILDKERGEVVGTMRAGMPLASPAVIDGATILASLGAQDKDLAAFSFRTMRETWRVALNRLSCSSPAVQGNICVCAITDGTLYGIDIDTRSERWAVKTGGGAFVATPAIDKNSVFFAPGNYDRNIYSVKLSDGDLEWKTAPDRSGMLPGDTIAGSNRLPADVFVKMLRLSPEHQRAAFLQLQGSGIDIPKGILQKSQRREAADTGEFYAYGEMKTSSVAVGHGNVFVVQKELGYPKPRFTLFALDKTSGQVSWKYSELRSSVPEGYCSSPVIANGKVFFGWGEGAAYAMDAATGELLWKDSLAGDIISSPAIADGVLYFVTVEGVMYAYDLNGTPNPTTFTDGTYCYPNPAKSKSLIQYFMMKPGAVEVRIFDASERMVRIFKKENVPVNAKEVFGWEVSGVANGTYFAIISVRYHDGTSDRKTLKIAVLK